MIHWLCRHLGDSATLLRAKPSKGGDAEPRGYRAIVLHRRNASRAASEKFALAARLLSGAAFIPCREVWMLHLKSNFDGFVAGTQQNGCGQWT
jgi:hypothetical protein